MSVQASVDITGPANDPVKKPDNKATENASRKHNIPDFATDPLPHKDAPRPYPIDALPPMIGQAVAEVNDYMRAPVAIPSMCALSGAAAAVQQHCDVQRGHINSPTSLYFLLLAVSGERKTSVEKFFLSPIRRWQNEQRERLAPQLAQYQAECDAYEITVSSAKQKLRDEKKKQGDEGVPQTAVSDLAKAVANKPKHVYQPQILIGDATPEYLLYRLAHDYPAGCIFSSEAGQIFGSHAMKAESIMSNLSHLNALWEGQPIDIGRRTSDSYTVQGARLSQCLAIQPGTFSVFLDRVGGLASDSGYLARFMLAEPDTTIGTRTYRESPDRWPALDRYHQRLRGLLDTYPTIEGGGLSDLRTLHLTGDAMEAWVDSYNKIELATAPGGDLHCIAATAAKAADNIARLSAVLSVFERGLNAEITADDVKRARLIVLWHLSEARRMTGTPAAPDALALERWLRTRGGSVTRTDTLQCITPARLRKAAVIDTALDHLIKLNRAIQRDGTIYLHPDIIGEG